MSRPIRGIVVGAAIGASGFWLALLVFGASVPAGLFVIAIALFAAMLAVAGFSGESEPVMLGIRATVAGLVGGSVIFMLFAVSGSGAMTLLLPAVTLGIGGAVAHPADRDPQRLSMRLIVSGAAAILVVLGGLININVWIMLAPIVPLPALAVADRLSDRSRS